MKFIVKRADYLWERDEPPCEGAQKVEDRRYHKWTIEIVSLEDLIAFLDAQNAIEDRKMHGGIVLDKWQDEYEITIYDNYIE